MTTPAHTRKQGANRGYVVNDEWHIGVTSLIKAALAQPQALQRWKDKRLANLVLDARADLDSFVIDRGEIIARAFAANYESSPEAQLGTDVHKVIEDYEQDVDIVIDDTRVLNHLAQWVKLKEEHDLQVLTTELTLVNTHYKYAGTVDHIVLTDVRPYTRQRFILDVKTGKGVYDTYALQLALLSRCDAWLDANGTLRPIREERKLNTQWGLIAKLGPRSCHLHKVDIRSAWRYARHLVDMWAFLNGEGAKLISASLPGKTERDDRQARNVRRNDLLERAQRLDAPMKQIVKAMWHWPKLTDPTLDWTHDSLDQVDELIANAERGALA